MNLFNLL
jgi:hypothetical protein